MERGYKYRLYPHKDQRELIALSVVAALYITSVQKFEYRFIVFWGGTCLRIFHGLQRFSEDMDFYKIAQNI